MVRRSIRAMLVTITVVCGLTVLSASPAAACSCGGGTEAQSFEAADVVFSGALIEVRTPTGDSFSSADPERFVFEVAQVYKGEARARQSVVTAREGASCGLELTGRGPFLVFAYTDAELDLEIVEGELSSHLCTGSRSLSESPVPVAFGIGTPPTAGASAIGEPSDGQSRVPLIAGATIVLAALGGGWLLVRRVRQAR